jgi:hypothetical protein
VKSPAHATLQGLSVASRALAAIAGGYGLIWVATPALTLLLPRIMDITLFDSVLAVTMSSFLVWAVIAMAVFHARSARRAWAWLLAGYGVAMLTLLALAGRPWP